MTPAFEDDQDPAHPEGWERDVLQSIQRDEDELGGIALELEFSIAVTQLEQHPGWIRLMSRLQTMGATDTLKLQTVEMSLERMRFLQGKLYVLMKAVNPRRLSEAEVDACRQRAKVLQDRLAENRKLLEP